MDNEYDVCDECGEIHDEPDNTNNSIREYN